MEGEPVHKLPNELAQRDHLDPAASEDAAHQLLSSPPDVWGGGAAIDWAGKLAGGSGYDPSVERLVDVTAALDAIYEHASDR